MNISEQLNALRGQQVSAFCHTLSGAHCMVEGPLVGGDLPGRPFGVINYSTDQSRTQANISFTPEQVKSIEIRSNQNIIILK